MPYFKLKNHASFLSNYLEKTPNFQFQLVVELLTTEVTAQHNL